MNVSAETSRSVAPSEMAPLYRGQFIVPAIEKYHRGFQWETDSFCFVCLS